jgi:hypothetical protein
MGVLGFNKYGKSSAYAKANPDTDVEPRIMGPTAPPWTAAPCDTQSEIIDVRKMAGNVLQCAETRKMEAN